MGGGPRIDTTEDEIGERGKLPAAGATRTTEKNQVGESTKKYKGNAVEEDRGRGGDTEGGS